MENQLPQLKKWYVEKQKDYHKFIKWILGDKEQVYILCDYFYIVEELHTCFKCGKLTQVIGYGYLLQQLYRFSTELYTTSTSVPVPRSQ